MTTNISKETINRLLKDVRHIIRNPLTDNGIYYAHDDSDVLKGSALIIGPADTPYFGGNYFFEIEYPADYPHSPPKVKYCTNGNNVRFNPNLYVCGKVCVSLLNTWRGDQWTSCQSISTMLLTLCTGEKNRFRRRRCVRMHIPYAPVYMLATRGTHAGKEALLYGETLSPDRYRSLYKHLGVQSMLVSALLESGSWFKAQLGAFRDLAKFRCRWLVLGPRWSPQIGTACSRCQPLPPIVLVPSDSTSALR